MYAGYVPEIKMLEELTIHDPPLQKPAAQIQIARARPSMTSLSRHVPATTANDSEVMPLHAVDRSVGYDLPPLGPLVRQFPEVDTQVFVMKHPLMPWIKGKVQQVIAVSPIQCRVKVSGRKGNGALKTLIGKHMAIAVPCSVVIPVATRVVAVFLDANSSDYYSGVIAEPPKSTNKYR